MHLGGPHFDTDEEVEKTVLHFLRGLAGYFHDSKIKKIIIKK